MCFRLSKPPNRHLCNYVVNTTLASSHSSSTCLELCAWVLLLLYLVWVCMFRSLHTSVNAFTENNPKNLLTPIPSPLWICIIPKTDPYLHAITLNSAVPVPPTPSLSTPCTMLCIYKLINLFWFNSASTSEIYLETYFHTCFSWKNLIQWFYFFASF